MRTLVTHGGRRSRFTALLRRAVLATAIAFAGLVDAPTAQAQRVEACPKYHALFAQYGLPVATFSKIAWRESRCNPKSVSEVRYTGRPDVGLLQIQASWATVTRKICHRQKVVLALTDPSCNVRVAAYLYANGGLRHWKATIGG